MPPGWRDSVSPERRVSRKPPTEGARRGLKETHSHPFTSFGIPASRARKSLLAKCLQTDRRHHRAFRPLPAESTVGSNPIIPHFLSRTSGGSYAPMLPHASPPPRGVSGSTSIQKRSSPFPVRSAVTSAILHILPCGGEWATRSRYNTLFPDLFARPLSSKRPEAPAQRRSGVCPHWAPHPMCPGMHHTKRQDIPSCLSTCLWMCRAYASNANRL